MGLFKISFSTFWLCDARIRIGLSSVNHHQVLSPSYVMLLDRPLELHCHEMVKKLRSNLYAPFLPNFVKREDL